MTGAPRELVLRSDALEVVLLPELGARIHRIRAFGHDLLRTPSDAEAHAVDPLFWGAYPMAPWCNRAPSGRRELAGRPVDLTANFVDGSAIHGLVYAERWDADADGLFAVRRGGAGDAWPWPFEVSLAATIDPYTLMLDYRLTNRSDAPMPAGIGLHPWFRRPLELRLPAGRVYPTNLASAGHPEPATARFDLSALASPVRGLDATWTGLDAPRIDLAWPRVGVTAVLAVATSAAATLVAVASPKTIDAVAIEPQTHGPDPLRRLDQGEPDAPLLLGAGDTLRLTLGLTVARAEKSAVTRQVWLDE
jgi:aldose 1-epimerase